MNLAICELGIPGVHFHSTYGHPAVKIGTHANSNIFVLLGKFQWDAYLYIETPILIVKVGRVQISQCETRHLMHSVKHLHINVGICMGTSTYMYTCYQRGIAVLGVWSIFAFHY